MGIFLESEQALNTALSTQVGSYPWSASGIALTDSEKENAKLWLQSHNLRADKTSITLGNNGEDQLNGIYQIDINKQIPDSPLAQLTLADTLEEYFVAGLVFVYNTAKVRIVSASLSPGRYVGGFYRVSLSVRYYTRKNRNL